jgi:hypothetical protein
MTKSTYCIPYFRDISNQEHDLLTFLLTKEAPERLRQIDSLKVIGKCGCGACPTVLFGLSFTDEPITSNHYILADYSGKNSNGGHTGVLLWANDAIITELEGYSLDGSEQITWPNPIDLKILEITRDGRDDSH